MSSLPSSLSLRIFPLRGAVQTYAWGRFAPESRVHRLHTRNLGQTASPASEEKGKHTASSTDATTAADLSHAPFAELWLGTHVSGPTVLADRPHISLESLLRERPELQGEVVSRSWPSLVPLGQLPFLLKVLSVRTALSIQAHPDKTLAEKLHAQSPDIYRDPNHKPEMAIAITPFEAMCQFRPLEELRSFVQTVPELAAMVGPEVVDALRGDSVLPSGKDRQTLLRKAFSTYARTPNERVGTLVAQLCERLASAAVAELSDVEKLVLRLNEQFPLDVGVFAPFFLNCITLQPGEAVFLAANEPHAYLSGDCVECMACSNNVVRAGLTPKFKDVDTLCNMLTYQDSPPMIYRPKIGSERTMYSAPVRDFSVERLEVGVAHEQTFAACASGSVLLCLSGEGSVHPSAESPPTNQERVFEGAAFFVGADTAITLSATQPLIVYRASCGDRPEVDSP